MTTQEKEFRIAEKKGESFPDSGTSLYVLSEGSFTEEEANEFLEKEHPALFPHLNFVEFDEAVASSFNIRFAATYHVK